MFEKNYYSYCNVVQIVTKGKINTQIWVVFTMVLVIYCSFHVATGHKYCFCDGISPNRYGSLSKLDLFFYS